MGCRMCAVGRGQRHNSHLGGGVVFSKKKDVCIRLYLYPSLPPALPSPPHISLLHALPRAQISDMSAEDVKKYCDEQKTKSVMPRVIKNGYSILQLGHYITAGVDEVKAWTVKKDTVAPKAAAVIHTDFEKNFIAAEIMSFDDYKACSSSEVAVRAAGKYRTEGKKYEVQDGDICYFKIGRSG